MFIKGYNRDFKLDKIIYSHIIIFNIENIFENKK